MILSVHFRNGVFGTSLFVLFAFCPLEVVSSACIIQHLTADKGLRSV